MKSNCKYCGKLRDLCGSHAIPDAFFKEIKKAGSGQGIYLNAKNSKAIKTNNSGEFPLLCASCERDFNVAFDAPVINELGKLRAQIQVSVFLVSSIPSDIFMRFIASVIWRASISKNEMYHSFQLKSEFSEKLKFALFGEISELNKLASYKVQYLYDDDDHFDPADLWQLVLAPNISAEETQKIYFVAYGFVFWCYVPKIKFARRSNIKPLSLSQKPRISAVDIFDIPGMLTSGVDARRKHEKGL